MFIVNWFESWLYRLYRDNENKHLQKTRFILHFVLGSHLARWDSVLLFEAFSEVWAWAESQGFGNLLYWDIRWYKQISRFWHQYCLTVVVDGYIRVGFKRKIERWLADCRSLCKLAGTVFIKLYMALYKMRAQVLVKACTTRRRFEANRTLKR